MSRYAAEVSADLPVARYTLGEKSGTVAYDKGSGAHNGAYVGSPVLGYPSLVVGGDGAVNFASGGRVDVAAAVLVATASITIEAWVNITSLLMTGMFVECGNSGNGYGLGVGNTDATNAGNNFLVVFEGIRWTAGPTPLGLGRHHVALVINASSKPALYIDGVQVYSDAGANAIAPTVRTSIAAQSDGAGSRPFVGVVDEVALYNSALSGSRIYAHWLAGVTADPVTTSAIWRDPRTTSALFKTDITAAKWQKRIRGMGTASLLVPRSDANAATLAKLLSKTVPMVTIERSDGNLPFVGYPVDPRFRKSDTHGAFQLADHTMLLSQGSTRIVAETRQASGQFLITEIREAMARGEIAGSIDLSQIKPGLSASLALSGQTLDALLRELEKQTGYEAFFSYQISPAKVTTFLQWRTRQGKDRRTEDRWIDGEQLADVQYNLNYTKGRKSASSVGGTGAVTARPAATAIVTTGTAKAVTPSATVIAASQRAGYGGALVEFVPQVTDPLALAARNVQIIRAPANALVSWEFDLIESAVDMSKVDVGDTHRLASQDAMMGQPVSGFARIQSIELNADFGVHKCVAVGVN